MKIVHITTHAGQGGDWTALAGLSSVFLQNGNRVHIYGSGSSTRVRNGHELYLNKGASGFARSSMILREILSSTDIVHCHSLAALALAVQLKLASKHTFRVVYTFHWAVNSGRIKRFVAKRLILRSDIIHAPSHDAGDYLSELYGIPRSKISICHFGVDAQRFTPLSQGQHSLVRKRLGIPENNFVAVYAGRLAPEKGVGQIIDFFGRHNPPNTQALIVGNGDLKAQLLAKRDAYGLRDKVFFVPHTDSVEEMYRAANLLLLPSVSHETFGLVVVEAALCGVPSLRSNLQGAQDQIIDGCSGFLYDPGHPTAFDDKLLSVLLNPDRLTRVGENARKVALERFSYEKMYDRFYQLYMNTIG
ncbi:glycosyltransferase family 4 protein [Roseitranquillus sediminis]|uniref:glycosyltransferase family 4 protein n=1 Tax=Roseitranquillus sediminis TaxID=2809051 RepID=UPI001D0CA60B|nr:glycosyltransferase family 4 protein [Roseitranquillus sediminis]MBM9594017.1 glycosyltransferase family 4 protein [Roseitranquillus sediminis]